MNRDSTCNSLHADLDQKIVAAVATILVMTGGAISMLLLGTVTLQVAFSAT